MMHSTLVCGLAASLAFAFSCADSTSPEPTGEEEEEEVSQNVCGDGLCAAAEVGYCMMDCGTGGNNNAATCGDGLCETTKGETATSCASDCGGTGSGTGSGSGSSTACPSDPTECFLCMLDPSLCLGGLDQNACLTCLGLGGGGGGGGGFGDLLCEGGAADGNCNAAAGEDNSTCPSDCP
jgi:hypothetical protein